MKGRLMMGNYDIGMCDGVRGKHVFYFIKNEQDNQDCLTHALELSCKICVSCL